MAYIDGNDVAYGVTNLQDSGTIDAYTKAETDALLNRKEPTALKTTEINAQSQTSDYTQYPTVSAVRDFVDAKIGDFEDYYDGELEGLYNDKVEKTTTIAGLPLTGNITVDQLKQALGIS